VGDWAEIVVLDYIRDRIAGCSNCVHRAANGETPGWDIDYIDAQGVLQRIEVKGTTGVVFSGIDLTVGELEAAQRYGSHYWIYLVAECLTELPKVQAIQNPYERLSNGSWPIRPALYTVRLSSNAETTDLVV
jgi:hypothetical protein